MKVYAVEQKYCDNGMVIANTRLMDVDTLPESHNEERKGYDFYVDYFTDPVKAEEWRQQALHA